LPGFWKGWLRLNWIRSAVTVDFHLDLTRAFHREVIS
jgi:hypothetical protein